MNPVIYCPLCGLSDTSVEESDGGNRKDVDCKRCGRFEISSGAAQSVVKNDVASKLSAWIRNRSELGHSRPEITKGNLDSILSRIPEYSVSDKQRIVLRALEQRTKYPGDEVELFFDMDYPIAWAWSADELAYLLSALIDRGLIEGPERFNNPWCSFVVTPRGWDALDELTRSSKNSNQAFVAMSFAKELVPAWIDGIKPALERAGYTAYRVDSEHHIDRIDAKIMVEIKNSKFVVADVTDQRQGVYFEAGYALGLGLPVIWSVRDDDLTNVHFDTRQYNHIVWNCEVDFQEQLFNRVVAVIGRHGE